MIRFFTLFTLLISFILNAQWKWQNPLPHGNGIQAIGSFNNSDFFVGSRDNLFFKYSNNFKEGSTDSFFTKPFTSLSLQSKIKTFSNGVGYILNQNEIYKTVDFGLTWNQLNDLSIFIDPDLMIWVDGNTGYIFEFWGNYFKTTDGGSTWESSNDLLFWEGIETAFFIDPNIGWVVQRDNNLYTTSNGGANWVKKATLEFIPEKLFFFDQNLGYAITGDILVKTTNGGSSWATVNSFGKALRMFNLDKDGNGYVVTMDGNRNYSFYSDVLFTDDGGNNWLKIMENVPYINAMDRIDEENSLIAGNGGIIFKTINKGKNWTQMNSSITNVNLRSVFFTSKEKGFIVGHNGTILITTNSGKVWDVKQTSQWYNLYDLYFVDSLIGWTVGGSGKILKTIDGGVNWIEQSNGTRNYIYSVHFVDKNNGWICGRAGSVFRTNDGGVTWDSLITNTLVDLLDIKFIDENRGWVTGYGSTLTTYDGGSSWQEFGPQNSEFSHMYIKDTSTIYLIGDLRIKTTDGGTTWTEMPSNIECVNFFDPNNDQVTLNTFLTYNEVRSTFMIDSTTGWMVGDYGNIISIGVDKPLSVDEEVSNNIPDNFLLSQNFPNPFNPSTTLSYSLPIRSNISIEIFDAIGNKIKTLINSEKEAGEYKITFNASDLSSGIYFYRLNSSGHSITKKMILIK